MTQKILIILFIAPLIISCSNKNWETETPTFDDFKAGMLCNLIEASTNPNIGNLKLTEIEEFLVDEQYLHPDNFYYCEYSIVTLENQDNTSRHLVFSGRSGNLIGSMKSRNGILFSKKSALIILDPIDVKGSPGLNTEYWIIKNQKMKRIK